MHCKDLPLTLNSHYCASEFFCFYAFYKFCSCSQQYIACPSSILLFLCISQINLSLSAVNLAHLRTTILTFLFISQTLLSLSSATDVHPSSILFFLCIVQAWLSFSRVITGQSSYLCIARCFFSLSTVIMGYSSSILLFLCIPRTSSVFSTIIFSNFNFVKFLFFCFYALHRPCSHS